MAAHMRSAPWRFCGFHKSCSNSKLHKFYSKQSRKSTWKSVVGLEIHAQILSNSKLFSGSPTNFGGAINSQVSFFDAALPGTLPVLNRKCVEAGVLTALALKSHINSVSKFDRKHYFYADLPAGYQITQQRQPLAVGGVVNYVSFSSGSNKQAKKHKARLIQIQLEQDSGKSLHDLEENQSLIDLNRAGVGLMEIVTEPDFTDGEDAAAFVKELQNILHTLGTCDGKMAEGSLRVDANISVNRPGEPLGVRSEVKNLNSIRAVARAIDYEIKRQIRELEAGREITNETRSFDVDSGVTVAMRDKERLTDYRFMPEPNLPPLHIYTNATLPNRVTPDVVLIDRIQSFMPELPEEKRTRIQRDYHLPVSTAVLLVNEEGLLEYFEAVMRDDRSRNVQSVANLLVNDLLGQLNLRSLAFSDSPVSPSQSGELADMFHVREISSTTVKKVLIELCDGSYSSPREIVERHDWFQVTDKHTLTELCKKVMQENPKSVKMYKAGKVNKLTGQVQKEAGGRADPLLLSEILQQTVT